MTVDPEKIVSPLLRLAKEEYDIKSKALFEEYKLKIIELKNQYSENCNKEHESEILIDKMEEERKIKEIDSHDDDSIESLDFSIRSYNCLKGAGINIRTLRQKTGKELFDIRNMGKKSFTEICEKLKEYGIEIEKPRFGYKYSNNEGTNSNK